jgi:thioredoxin 1
LLTLTNALHSPLLLHPLAWLRRCGPCKLIEPVLEQCAEDWKDSIVVGKFDVEDSNGSRNLKVELILQGAMPQALPALILVHNNKILDTWKGVISPTELQDLLKIHVVQGKSRKFRGIGLVNNF